VEGLDKVFGMTRESDNAGDLLGEFEAGGEREFGLLRVMLRGCVSVRAIGNGDDDRVILRGPRGRCMTMSLLAVVATKVVVKVTKSPLISFIYIQCSQLMGQNT
jgi:hypothetical protein